MCSLAALICSDYAYVVHTQTHERAREITRWRHTHTHTHTHTHYSKKVMGYELCDNMEAASTLKALKMALRNRKYPQSELMHHSDRGLQYCSKLYTDYLNKNRIIISMTENGDPYENAIAERMNGILKDEFGLGERMEDIQQAQRLTQQSIDAYNQLRPHLSCHYLTPEQMHNQQKIRMRTWKKKAAKPDRALLLS